MKTRVILNPIDSPLRFQRSDDGYFDGTGLLNYYNSLSTDSKSMPDFKKLKSTKDLVDFLIANEKLVKKPLLATLKGTWMHPYVFIDFAMWLSMEFKVQVLGWVYDGLIVSRNLAGDYYKEMCSELLNQRNVLQKDTAFFHYIQESKMLQDLSGVVNRNEVSEKQLSLLNTLQIANINFIKEGMPKDKRYTELRRIKNVITLS